MILLLAGTSDARLLLHRMKSVGLPVAVSVTTKYGAALLEDEADLVNQAKLDAQGLQQLFQKWDITLVVDATHPYAAEASQNALTATRNAKISYFRYERAALCIDKETTHDLLHKVSSVDEAAVMAGNLGETIFLTTGSKNLPEFVHHPALANKRVVARVLPEADVVAQCRSLGLQPRDIVAMQGPFSQPLNKELFLSYGAQVIVTKESGKLGGCDTKLAAALELSLPVVMIERPLLAYGRSTDDVEELLTWITGRK